MAGPVNSQGDANPLGRSIALLVFLAIGLWWADVFRLDGDNPTTPGWRLAGWAVVVLVLLQWRTLLAGGVIALRLLVVLFIAAALAFAFSGDRSWLNF